MSEYIKREDYDYIINKHHNSEKPYDNFNRFIRNDAIFSSDTGWSGDEIIKGMTAQDETNKELPHAIRKAKAFSFVVLHTRISCDKRDRFPAIHMIDRPLAQTLVGKWKRELFEEIIPETGKKRAYYEQAGIVTMWPDFDHTVPNWERLLSLGFRGILEESERIRKEKPRTEEEEAFFEGIRLTYEAILLFIARLEKLARETEGSSRLAEALYHIGRRAPETFYEALLVNYLYFMLSEHVDSQQVRSLSNFDRIYYPFMKRDMERGVTEEEIRQDLAYYLMQFATIDNYWGQPVYLGGSDEKEETIINPLSYIFLDVYDKLGIYNPKVQLKLGENTPKAFILKALSMIRRGHNSIVLVSEKTIRKALENSGVHPNAARLCNITGCYEYSVIESMCTGMNYMNLLKPLEYALHEGCDGVTGVFCGRKSPKAEELTTFEAFYTEYKKHLLYLIDCVMEVVNDYENYLSFISPQSMLSATFESCMSKAKDALSGGGATNATSLDVGFIADAADSLTAVKKFVYDKKMLTLAEFRDILDRDFEGHEPFRRMLLADKDKYGNNRDLPDRFAVELMELIAGYVKGKPNAKAKNDKWKCGFHVARMSYVQGKSTASSPNGRLKGEELSKNCSAAMGQNKEGATAAILSVTKLPATSIVGDCSLDLGLLPSAVKGEEGLEAMYALWKTFEKRGGHALHINVFDAETLRNAQKYPEKYQDLQIRVCGWNVLWNKINKEEQDGFIRQAESLV